MVFWGKKDTKEQIEQIEQEIGALNESKLPNIQNENVEYKFGSFKLENKQIYIQYVNKRLTFNNNADVQFDIGGATRIINLQLTFSHGTSATEYSAALPWINFDSGATTIQQGITPSFQNNRITLSNRGLNGQKTIRGYVYYLKD